MRNLGLFVKTGGCLLDVALMKAIDAFLTGTALVSLDSSDSGRPHAYQP